MYAPSWRHIGSCVRWSFHDSIGGNVLGMFYLVCAYKSREVGSCNACYAQPLVWPPRWVGDKPLTHTYALLHGLHCVAMASFCAWAGNPLAKQSCDWPEVISSFVSWAIIVW